MTATIATIKEIIAKLKGAPDLALELPDDADLLRDVGLDSLELLQFMLDAEERLAIRIDFNTLEYSTLQSITGLARFFESMPAREPAANVR
jgi:acyl carrier protein